MNKKNKFKKLTFAAGDEKLDELVDFGLEQQQKQTRGQKDEQEKQNAQRAQKEQTDGDD